MSSTAPSAPSLSPSLSSSLSSLHLSELPPPPALARRAAAEAAAPTPAPPAKAGARDDLSHLKHNQKATWYGQIMASYDALTRGNTRERRPVPIARLVRETGLHERVVKTLVQEHGWSLDLHVRPPREDAAPTPEDIRAHYVTVEEARKLLGTSKSHVYVALRQAGAAVRTAHMAGTRFILREDLAKLAPVRRPRRPGRTKAAD